MALKPVTNYPAPAYPQKEFFTSRPELFDRCLPFRWSAAKLSAGAFAAALCGGCSINGPGQATTQPGLPHHTTVYDAANPGQDNSQQKRAADSFYVAPLFLHGDGTGATGCVMMSPPAFLTEAEACTLIVQTLRENGVTVDKSDTVLASANLLRHRLTSNNGKCVDSTSALPLALSGFSSEYATGFRFISFYDAESLQSGSCECSADSLWMMCSSVSSYDLKETAAEAAAEIRRAGGLNAGVFYDPCAGNYTDSRSLLRQQVLDFIQFLRDHNVLPDASVLNR
jgi:hypothetical protein